MKEFRFLLAPSLQVARIEWNIFQDWIPLDQQCTRTHKHLESLQHFVDRNDLGSICCCRGGFAISDTQNDRSSISVSVRLVTLRVIQNVEDDIPSCLHLNWPIRFRGFGLKVGVRGPTRKVSQLPLSLRSRCRITCEVFEIVHPLGLEPSVIHATKFHPLPLREDGLPTERPLFP